MQDRIQAKVGQALALLAMVRDSNGDPITPGGSPEATLRQDYGAFTDLADPDVEVLTEPSGTVADPDPRWNPGTDGEDGFNVVVTIPADVLVAVGTYFATFNQDGAVATWLIVVGSGIPV